MAEKEKRTHIRVTLSTAQKLSCMAKILGKNRLQFVEELTNSVFEILGEHSSANLSYESRVTSGILQIQILPKETYQFPVSALNIANKSKTEIPVEGLSVVSEKKEYKSGE